MGSISSRPKVPQAVQPQIIYLPTPAQNMSAPTPGVRAPQPAPAPGTLPESTSEADTNEQARKASLLQRNRGVFGTVRTSFRGLLSLAAQGPQRKTLLGE